MIPRGPLKMIQPRGIRIKNSCNSLRGPIGGSRRDKPHRKIRASTIHGPVKEEYGFLVETFARFAIESTFAPPIDVNEIPLRRVDQKIEIAFKFE